eukprot:g17003.t1
MQYEFESCVLNTLTREMWTSGVLVSVEPKAFDLVVHLLENRDRVVSKDELIETIWDGRFISDSSLSTAVKSARKAIGDDGDAQRIIKTVRGHGMRFVAEVREPETSPSPALATLLRNDLGELPTIAVMPFEHLSQVPDQDYFADGICEDIIAALGRIRWLRVISRNSTFSYRNQSYNLTEAAEALGARYIVVGSVRKANDRVRVAVQLLDGATGSQIWADRHDRVLEDVFEVQDDITERIVAALEPEVSVSEFGLAQRKPTQDLTAWDFVMRALARKSENTETGSREAIALLDKALAIDPNYARALGLRAWIVIWRVHQGWDDPHTAVQKAMKDAQKAVTNDANEIWAFVAYGFIATVLRDKDMMLNATRRVLEINPSFAVGHSYMGAGLAVMGRGKEAFPFLDKARELSPRDIQKGDFEVHESFAHFQVTDYEAAYRAAHRASLLEPGHAYPRYIMASSLAHLGYNEEAASQVEAIRSIVPDATLASIRASCVFMVEDDVERFLAGLEKAGLS